MLCTSFLHLKWYIQVHYHLKSIVSSKTWTWSAFIHVCMFWNWSPLCFFNTRTNVRFFCTETPSLFAFLNVMFHSGIAVCISSSMYTNIKYMSMYVHTHAYRYSRKDLCPKRMFSTSSTRRHPTFIYTKRSLPKRIFSTSDVAMCDGKKTTLFSIPLILSTNKCFKLEGLRIHMPFIVKRACSYK